MMNVPAQLRTDQFVSVDGSPIERGVRITGVGLTTRHRNGAIALDDVSLTIEPGQLTAVIGPSGAGKTTLLRALAGVAPAHQGIVEFSGDETTSGGTDIGFVPQDDILHQELPLRRTLRYAAALRISASRAAIDAAVTAAGHIGPRNSARFQSFVERWPAKRASVASEILTGPVSVFWTTQRPGPAAAADLITYLHRMSAQGSTVVFTTHSVEDIERSDKVVVLAPGGRLLMTGTPSDVLERLAADTFTELYARLASENVERIPSPGVTISNAPRLGSPSPERPEPAGPVASGSGCSPSDRPTSSPAIG